MRLTLAYRLLVSDIDGTLANSANEITDINQQAISLFRQSGGQFTFATGRSYSEARRFIHLMNPDIPVILCNGAVLYDPSTDQLTPLATLNRDVATNLLTHLTELQLNIDIFVYTVDAVYATQVSPLARSTMVSEDFHLKMIENFDLLADVPWIKLVVVAEHDEMKQLHELSKTVNYDLELVQSWDSWFEILPPNVSKSTALARIAKELGVPFSQVTAVGDHLNDISMLRQAGISAAVANAHPQVLQTADIIVPSNDFKAMVRS
jgi:Cof subfamily protein (haloacid dehalogenase superfamily)